ncbi:type II toxin-antitoxin system RelE/ParE family toxin [Pseudoxanthomonas beigongshangi]|uniref:type II toxin-antitoxin system RelE/ParE family toxin n=1 Tax=Pseudoxanthomonas beigongshangi TaxID=2782537 RepID=UPI00193C7C3C|nr:type II toxin-antitoxin system RelE/ParE family toxin [Pseudoxanthomonas beigongshangi]
MANRIEYAGRKLTIELLCDDDGQCPAAEFLDGLDEGERRKVDVLFEMLGENGRIPNREKFKKLEGSSGVFEFKSFQVRLLCFFTPTGRVVITHGVRKQKNKHDAHDITYAERRRKKFLGE